MRVFAGTGGRSTCLPWLDEAQQGEPAQIGWPPALVRQEFVQPSGQSCVHSVRGIRSSVRRVTSGAREHNVSLLPCRDGLRLMAGSLTIVRRDYDRGTPGPLPSSLSVASS